VSLLLVLLLPPFLSSPLVQAGCDQFLRVSLFPFCVNGCSPLGFLSLICFVVTLFVEEGLRGPSLPVFPGNLLRFLGTGVWMRTNVISMSPCLLSFGHLKVWLHASRNLRRRLFGCFVAGREVLLFSFRLFISFCGDREFNKASLRAKQLVSQFHLCGACFRGELCYFGELKIVSFSSLTEWVTWCRSRISRASVAHFHLVHVRFTRLLFRSVFCTHPSLPLEGREVLLFIFRLFISFWGDREFNKASLRAKQLVSQFHLCNACFRGELEYMNKTAL